MKCLRSVLSGLEDGPPVGEMVQLLGKEQTLRRINFAIECLSKESVSTSQKKLWNIEFQKVSLFFETKTLNKASKSMLCLPILTN